MLRKSCKLSAVFFWALVFAVCQLETVVLAGLAPSGTPILIVDGIDSDTTVSPVITNNPIFGSFVFGQVIGGAFSPITAPLQGNTLVDFAITGGGCAPFCSLTTPNVATTVTANLTGTNLSGFAENPGGIFDYYNTLEITWTGVGGIFGISLQSLNGGGGNTDGFAAVPLPPAVLLFGTGLIGLIGIARRSFFVS